MTATKAIERSSSRPGFGFVLVFLLLAAGFVATGWFYHRNHERHYRAEAEQQLSIIGDLKVDELALWRRQRLGDGGIAFNASSTVMPAASGPTAKSTPARPSISP